MHAPMAVENPMENRRVHHKPQTHPVVEGSVMALHCHHGWRIPALKSMILPASSGAVSSGVNPRVEITWSNSMKMAIGQVKKVPAFVFFGDSSVMQHKVVARKMQYIHRIFSWLLEHLTRVEMNRGWITAWSSQWSGNMEKHDRRCSLENRFKPHACLV